MTESVAAHPFDHVVGHRRTLAMLFLGAGRTGSRLSLRSPRVGKGTVARRRLAGLSQRGECTTGIALPAAGRPRATIRT